MTNSAPDEASGYNTKIIEEFRANEGRSPAYRTAAHPYGRLRAELAALKALRGADQEAG